MTTKPTSLIEAVLKPSVELSKDVQEVRGVEFQDHKNITACDLVDGMRHMGFQASALARACEIINEMRGCREKEPKGNTIFLGYTSNLISSGLRSTLCYLVKNRHVDILVTTAGGVEEDLIKCLAKTYMGDFTLEGSSLRDKGLNRIGNLIVPNDNYCKFEDWLIPILDKMQEEQERDKVSWTPSKVIERLGLEINNEESVLYWAAKNKIPVFCPALTDGSLGDMLFFHTFQTSPPLKIDIVEDVRRINLMAMKASSAGLVILGGGIIKHHIANACLMRNGADFAVYINTGQEFDGSDAGARPDEAVSWGKIRAGAKHVKVYADATLVFPLIVGATWAAAAASD